MIRWRYANVSFSNASVPCATVSGTWCTGSGTDGSSSSTPEIFSRWPHFKQSSDLPKAPRPAVEYLTSYFRYAANLARLTPESSVQVACIVRNANLLAPMAPGALDYDLSAIASLIRDWASESLLTTHSLATFLIVENLNDLHPLIANNPERANGNWGDRVVSAARVPKIRIIRAMTMNVSGRCKAMRMIPSIKDSSEPAARRDGASKGEPRRGR